MVWQWPRRAQKYAKDAKNTKKSTAMPPHLEMQKVCVFYKLVDFFFPD